MSDQINSIQRTEEEESAISRETIQAIFGTIMAAAVIGLVGDWYFSRDTIGLLVERDKQRAAWQVEHAVDQREFERALATSAVTLGGIKYQVDDGRILLKDVANRVARLERAISAMQARREVAETGGVRSMEQ